MTPGPTPQDLNNPGSGQAEVPCLSEKFALERPRECGVFFRKAATFRETLTGQTELPIVHHRTGRQGVEIVIGTINDR